MGGVVSTYHCDATIVQGLSQGITSVCDMALCAIPGTDFVYDDIYRELLGAGQIPMRVHLYPQNVGTFERVESLQTEFRGKMVQVPGTKHTAPSGARATPAPR